MWQAGSVIIIAFNFVSVEQAALMRGGNLCIVYHCEFQTVASRGLLQMCFMLLLWMWPHHLFQKANCFIEIVIPRPPPPTPLYTNYLLKSLEYGQTLIVCLSFWCCFGPSDLIFNTF